MSIGGLPTPSPTGKEDKDYPEVAQGTARKRLAWAVRMKELHRIYHNEHRLELIKKHGGKDNDPKAPWLAPYREWMDATWRPMQKKINKYLRREDRDAIQEEVTDADKLPFYSATRIKHLQAFRATEKANSAWDDDIDLSNL